MKAFYLRLARWSMVLLGGVLLGGGLVLHAQVAVAYHMREEVDNTFFLWRGIGRLTFMFQKEVTQTAFSLRDIPQSVMLEADRAAWVLVGLGVVIAASSCAIRPRRRAAATGGRSGRR